MSGLMDIEAPDPVTPREAAELVGTSYSNVRKWIHRGLLKTIASDERGNLVDRNDVFEVHRRVRNRRRLPM